MRARLRVTVGVALVLVLGALGCSGGDDDAASSDASGEAIAASGDGGDDGVEVAAPDDEDGGGGGVGLPTGDPIQAGRSIIATAEVSFEVDDVRQGSRRASDAAAAAGGFLAQQEANPSDGVATLTLRVPTDRFSAVLGELEAIGKVLTQRIDTEDVTEQVVDLESRISSARTSVERVRDLLDESGDVVQLATVEGELSRRESDLELLLGRQRVLDDQVAMATIHVDLREPAAVQEEDDEDPLPGFVGGLRGGWDAFVTSASVVVTVLGYTLPFLVLAGVLWTGWLWGRRFRRPRTAIEG